MTIDLSTVTLAKGSHNKLADGACLLELCSYMASEPWSDHPKCVSPVLGAFGRRLNDGLADEARQRLLPLAERMLNTAGDGQDAARSAMARHALMTDWLPAWLRLAKLEDLALRAEQTATLTGRELSDALRAIRSLTWSARRERRAILAKRIREEMVRQGKPADADADADAVADGR